MALLAPLDISTSTDAVAEQRVETDQDLDRPFFDLSHQPPLFQF